MQKGAYILSTGTELSTGYSRDSNAPYLARELKQRGLCIVGLGIVPDEPILLSKALGYLLEQTEIDLLLLSGGLGPTSDDHTVDILAEIFSQKIIEEPRALRSLERLYQRYPEHLRWESARRQVRTLEKAQALKNQVGLAPGFILEWKSKKNECLLAVFPGVPREMEAMFQKSFLNIWEQKFPQKKQNSPHKQVFYLYGIGESHFQETFFKVFLRGESLSASLEKHSEKDEAIREQKLKGLGLTWGISAEPGYLKIFCETKDFAMLEDFKTFLKENFQKHFAEESALQLLHEFCAQEKIKIGTAESCTGGLIAKLLTDRAGSSLYFKGSIISYANEIKNSHLEVSQKILEEKGAVSEECVLAMAKGAVKNLNVDFALAVSGIAGPTGGTPEKAVGTVYLGFAAKNEAKEAHRLVCPLRGREGIREYCAHIAIFRFYSFICVQRKALR